MRRVLGVLVFGAKWVMLTVAGAVAAVSPLADGHVLRPAAPALHSRAPSTAMARWLRSGSLCRKTRKATGQLINPPIIITHKGGASCDAN
jgi:hypothetical protein